MKFYRTYIFEYKTSSSTLYYGGKKISQHENPDDDPYTGSGIIISNAIRKYGPSCITNKTWFTHSSNKEMLKAEKQLIKDLKEKYGDKCTNIAGGGEGNTWEYMTEEQRLARNKATSEGLRNSVKAKETAKKLGDSLRGKKKPLEHCLARRTSKVWQCEEELYDLWLKYGAPKCVSFKAIATSNGYPDDTYGSIVNRFNERFELLDAATKNKVKSFKKSRLHPILGNHYDSIFELWLKLGAKKCATCKLENSLEQYGFPKANCGTLTRDFNIQLRDEFDQSWADIIGLYITKKEKKPKLTTEERGNRIRQGRLASNKQQKRRDHWKHFDDLFVLWSKSNKPSYHVFRSIAVANGFPDVNYAGMLLNFKKVA